MFLHYDPVTSHLLILIRLAGQCQADPSNLQARRRQGDPLLFV